MVFIEAKHHLSFQNRDTIVLHIPDEQFKTFFKFEGEIFTAKTKNPSYNIR
ncbi:hypothetical protein D3C71_933570 [compost metagenome]